VFEMLEQQRTYQLSGGIYSRQKIMFTFKKIVIQPQNLRRRSSANSKKNFRCRTQTYTPSSLVCMFVHIERALSGFVKYS
jgi:hypothetical protein